MISTSAQLQMLGVGNGSINQAVNNKIHNIHVYQFIRENGGFDAWDMVQVEQYEAKDKRALHTRERHCIETLGATLNKVVPARSKQKYYHDNKEQLAGKRKEWGKANEGHMKQYRETNKEQIAAIRKQYKEREKEQIQAQRKQYYDDNKEQLLLKINKKN